MPSKQGTSDHLKDKITTFDIFSRIKHWGMEFVQTFDKNNIVKTSSRQIDLKH